MLSWEFDYLSESQFEYISADFIDEEKAYIRTATDRLRRIWNWTPDDDEDSLYDRRRGPDIMRELLSQYNTWKEFLTNQALEMKGIQHLIIFSLTKLALCYWITDTRIVANVLRELFECDGHFSSMFAHIIDRNDRQSLLRQTSDYSRQREDSTTIFFLHHAHKAKLVFSGVRFQDLRLQLPLCVPPVFLAAIYLKPNILLHLLRFGAYLDIPDGRLTAEWNLPMLLRHLLRVLWNSLGGDLEPVNAHSLVVTSGESDMIHRTADCFCILLRVIPQIQMGAFNFLLMKFNDGILSGSVNGHDFIRQLSERRIVPMLASRYLEPSSLQHLCRCVVRNELNRTWNLPYGVSSLPLPTLLKNYLCLAYD